MTADIVFHNGNVITVNKTDEIAQAVAVKEDKILQVGSDAQIEKLIGKNTKVIDLNGRSLIPGFIDSHLHFGNLGMNCSAIDCRYPAVKSIAEIKEKIREAAKTTPPGQWIRGWGYDHSKLIEKRHPTREDLDDAAPDHPVMLIRTCVHISANNSLSLKLAGISEETPPIPGGVMEKDEHGRLNGVMKENAHMAMQRAAMPSEEEMKNAFRQADELLIKQGITSVHDAGGYGKFQFDLEEAAAKNGEIKTKINGIAFSFIKNLDLVEYYIEKGPDQQRNPHFQMGPIKLMIDGSSSGPTAATLEPYCSNPQDYGILSMEQEQIDDIILRAHQKGFQVTCHAVGDRAVTAIVSAIEKALAQYPRPDHRHRIEHCAMINEALLTKIKRLGIIPIPQPIFLYEFGDGYLVNYGPQRAEKMFPCKTFIDQDIPAAGSSDCPVTFSNPLLGIHLAVNRLTQSGQSIGQEERIDKMQALRMFTYNGAYASFEEDRKGSIEEGKAADLVVLSANYVDCAATSIKDLTVDLTMIDGKIAYDRIR